MYILPGSKETYGGIANHDFYLIGILRRPHSKVKNKIHDALNQQLNGNSQNIGNRNQTPIQNTPIVSNSNSNITIPPLLANPKPPVNVPQNLNSAELVQQAMQIQQNRVQNRK